MFDQMVTVHAVEHYRDLLREAEGERRCREAGPAQTMRLLRGLGSALLAALAIR